MTYPEKYAHFLPKISKNMREKFITTLGNFPPSQTPRKRRGKSDGECESSSGRCSELCHLIPHIIDHHQSDRGAEHTIEFSGFGFVEVQIFGS